MKPRFSLLRPPPVPAATRPVDPNLADLFRCTTPERFGIDNLDFRIESLVSATDERARVSACSATASTTRCCSSASVRIAQITGGSALLPPVTFRALARPYAG